MSFLIMVGTCTVFSLWQPAPQVHMYTLFKHSVRSVPYKVLQHCAWLRELHIYGPRPLGCTGVVIIYKKYKREGE
jgi:hypothetical protein